MRRTTISLPASAIARDALSNYLGIGRAGEQREREWDQDARGR